MDEDLTQVNTETENPENQEQEGQEQTQETAEQQIDWENEQNPYRKRYSDSQSQITPLVQTLQQFAEYDHNTKQWKPKAPAQEVKTDDFSKEFENYDPTFRKALEGYTQAQIKNAITEFKKESSSISEYTSGVEGSRNKAISEFGTEFDFAKDGKMNMQSPLYKLADDIVQSKYAEFNPDGTFCKYTNPDAEYLATVEAYAILAKRSKQQTSTNTKKFNAIQGKGSKDTGVKRTLSYEEYSKLPSDQQDAYDLTERGG